MSTTMGMIPAISNQRFVLISRLEGRPTLYYGPFVSQQKAEEYRDRSLSLEEGAKAAIKPLISRQ